MRFSNFVKPKRRSEENKNHIKFIGRDYKLHVVPKDRLVQIIDKLVEEFENKNQVIDFLRSIKEHSVKIRLVKEELLNTEMISEDVMRCKVDVDALQKLAKWSNRFSMKEGEVTFNMQNRSVFVDRGDVLLKITDVKQGGFEIDVTEMCESVTQIKEIINQITV